MFQGQEEGGKARDCVAHCAANFVASFIIVTDTFKDGIRIN